MVQLATTVVVTEAGTGGGLLQVGALNNWSIGGRLRHGLGRLDHHHSAIRLHRLTRQETTDSTNLFQAQLWWRAFAHPCFLSF